MNRCWFDAAKVQNPAENLRQETLYFDSPSFVHNICKLCTKLGVVLLSIIHRIANLTPPLTLRFSSRNTLPMTQPSVLPSTSK